MRNIGALQYFRSVVCVFLLGVTCQSQNPAQMDQVVQTFFANREFTGSVLLARGEDILFSKSYGAANLEWGIPNEPTTRFRIASITKQFTAAAILLLEEHGQLKIGEPVKTYMPDAPTAWSEVTLFHLLTHTSGIPDVTSLSGFSQMEPFDTPVVQTVAKFRDLPLEFEPGERFSYSNSGYILLGYLLERISGQSYADFMRENIFTPLGMNESGYDLNSSVIARRASGYSSQAGALVNANFIHMSIPHAAGGLYSTTGDLLRWAQGVFGGKLLSSVSLNKMTTPFKGDYGMGVYVDTVNGRKRVFHPGSIQGFSTFFVYYPESKVVAIALGNLESFVASNVIASQLGLMAHGAALGLSSKPIEITLQPEALSRYVGTYESTPTVRLVVALDDGQLVIQRTGSPPTPVFAHSDTKFFFKDSEDQLEFVKDAQGNIIAVIRYVPNVDRSRTFSRVSNTPEQH
jgi:CubicO group peptidase (beta-lactamase class C family)